MEENRCLRCGRVMGKNDEYCKHCRHYYDTNLNDKKTKKKNPLIIIITIIVVLVVLIYILSKLLSNNASYEYCEIKCENGVKAVGFSNCICNDGTKVPLE